MLHRLPRQEVVVVVALRLRLRLPREEVVLSTALEAVAPLQLPREERPRGQVHRRRIDPLLVGGPRVDDETLLITLPHLPAYNIIEPETVAAVIPGASLLILLTSYLLRI